MRHGLFAGRLLVGLDGQQLDVQMIRYAAMVARLHQPAEDLAPPAKRPAAPATGLDPEVRFVYLFPRVKALPRGADGAPLRSPLRDHVNTYFKELPGRVAIGYDVLKGDALERLSAFAADFDSDLLLLGQSSWSPATCARIAMEAPCPVWLVPPGWAPVVRRLLVPCDFSEWSAAALRAAIEIARRSRHAKCLVLHVYWNGSKFDDEHIRRQEELQLQDRYDRFLAAIDLRGVTVEPLFVEGYRVDQQIERAAERHRVDLVVTSTRGRTPPARVVLPSIADRVIRRCQASFLVLRSADQPMGLLQALRQRLARAEGVQFG